jgi:hypothetical protein
LKLYEVGEHFVAGSSMTLNPRQKGEIKGNEMGKECITRGGEEDFGGNSGREDDTAFP